MNSTMAPVRPARLTKLEKTRAPKPTMKIMAVVRQESIKASANDSTFSLPRARANNIDPKAPMPAASVGVKTPR